MYKNNFNAFVVEDDSISLLVMEKLLKRICCVNKIFLASNYSDAINGINYYKPNLIFMDINLGDDSICGIDIVNEIKTVKYNPYIVYTTAYSDVSIKQRALDTFPYAYVNKPVESACIKRIVGDIYNDVCCYI